MHRAGAAAAGEITQRYPELLARGVLVLAGPGNNGGDGWVVARALSAAGVDVSVWSPEPPRSQECIAERELTKVVPEVMAYSGEGVVVDALLGTGASGTLRGAMAGMPDVISLARSRGAAIVAIDLPSGLDATTGERDGAITADLTLTFGAVKRGHLVTRSACGQIVALHIGHLPGVPGIPLADARWVRETLPPITAEAHKGSRKKLVIHGGAPGMAGAVILGLRAALASGIGMVKARVHPDSAAAVHAAVPAALVEPWSDDDAPDEWADALVIGPGLGSGPDARRAVERALKRHYGPVLLDADALNAFQNDADALGMLIGDLPALLTPHPAEAARLLGWSTNDVLDQRFDGAAISLAMSAKATVLLKGVPTMIHGASGAQRSPARMIVAEGTPTLATGGSGDLLCGIAGTLLAQMSDPLDAAACAAFVHGRAARLAGAFTRGTTLEDVLEMLPNAWRIDVPPPRYPVIAELPAIPSR